MNTSPGIIASYTMPPAQKAALGIRDGQLRLSIGIEDIDDILADLAQALAD